MSTNHRSIRLFPVVLLFSALLGCSPLPSDMRKAPAGDPGVAVIRDAPDEYQGQTVRWGGTIVGVENLAESTRLIVVSRPLYDNGSPTCEDRSNGRFIVEFDRFLDPAIFATGYLVTITGAVVGQETLPIGQFPYRLPVVKGQQLYLWGDQANYCRSEPPYWYYDPWYYDPWYHRDFYPYRSPWGPRP